MTDKQDFIFEIGTEELPPKALRRLSDAFGAGVVDGLKKAGLEYASAQLYAGPRRLAILLKGLDGVQGDTVSERRGPALSAAFDESGSPTPAALGFARSCGVAIEELERVETDKGAWFVFRQQQKGRLTSELMPGIIEQSLAGLPIPRRMHWGSLRDEFVRPVHWIVMLLGNEVIETTMFGVTSGRETRGHRFHHPQLLYLAEPAAYAPLLESEGHVMADFAARRAAIRAQVEEVAVSVDGHAVIDEDLLDEVTAMIEWPAALVGNFESRFLEVPAEALISAMKGHQKYFHVVDAAGKLMPCFITVSNVESKNMAVVRAGNERVIRPRLSDAAFFWDQDRKQRLIEKRERLKTVVFQAKLGTLYEKSQRLASLAASIAEKLGADKFAAEQAGYLAKCDLMTAMVGEFPELQGVMGRYYAQHDGEPLEVANALDEQYMPRFSGDDVPAASLGQALAIADKLDSLIGIFGIGQPPSGDKDPFALRRASIGVLRTIIERKLPLDLMQLIHEAAECYNTQGNINVSAEVADDIFGFMMERLRAYYLDAGIRPDVIEAVMLRRTMQPYDFDKRVRAVEVFYKLPEAESLAAANKRINNILRQSSEKIPTDINSDLLKEEAEQVLAKHLHTLSAAVQPLLDKGEYSEALSLLAALRPAVDAFFDKVMVMVDDTALRVNRLALLSTLHQLFMHIADISCLQIQNQS